MQIDFSTYQYQVSHGRAPRGRGSWVFEFPHSSAVTAQAMAAMGSAKGVSRVEVVPGTDPVVQVWTFSMTYAEAKAVFARAMRAAFPQAFYATVVVAP